MLNKRLSFPSVNTERIEIQTKELKGWRDELSIRKKKLNESIKKKNRSKEARLEELAEFEKIRNDEILYRKALNKKIQEYQATVLLNDFLLQSKDAPLKYDRVIIGSGIAATLVFSSMGKDFRNNVIVLNDVMAPNSWLRGGDTRLMAQPSYIQTPSMMSVHSTDYLPSDESSLATNPYGYVRMSHFSNALIEMQNDLEMPILNLKAGLIESKTEQTDWTYMDKRYRIPVYMSNKTQHSRPITYIYTNYIDLCQGLGHPRGLERSQINADLESKLIQEGRLLYDPQDTKKIIDNVVFYGASGGCASMIAEMEQARAKGVQGIAKIQGWYTRTKDDFKNRDAMRGVNRLIGDLLETENAICGGKSIEMRDGCAITSVMQNDDGTINVTFNTGRIITCSQLAISIAQTPIDLTTHLNNSKFSAYQYKGVPIGIISNDKSITFWGASGTNINFLETNERSNFLQLLIKHGKSLPFETQGAPTIFNAAKKIELMVEFLTESGVFQKNKRAASLSLPNINSASYDELVEIMLIDEKKWDKSKCQGYANILINERSKAIRMDTNKPGGIHHEEDIDEIAKSHHIPQELIDVLKQTFFPFSRIKLPEKTVIPRSFFKTAEACASNDKLIDHAENNSVDVSDRDLANSAFGKGSKTARKFRRC